MFDLGKLVLLVLQRQFSSMVRQDKNIGSTHNLTFMLTSVLHKLEYICLVSAKH